MGILGYWVPTSSCPRRSLSEAGCGSQGPGPDDHKLAAAEDSVSTFQVGDEVSVQTLLCAARHWAEILEAGSLNQGTRCLARWMYELVASSTCCHTALLASSVLTSQMPLCLLFSPSLAQVQVSRHSFRMAHPTVVSPEAIPNVASGWQ